jgi:hypothetical protein
MRDLLTIFAVTGAVVWGLLAIVLAAIIVVGVIPAVWRWLCYCGFSAFADAEGKRAARAIGREHAESKARIAALSRKDPQT